jgi:chromosome segregation ATPase
MKKITMLALALGLTMPAHSWTLFPVREKVVIETKTNYTATVVVGAVGIVSLLASLAGIGYIWREKNELQDDNNHLHTQANTDGERIHNMEETIASKNDDIRYITQQRTNYKELYEQANRRVAAVGAENNGLKPELNRVKRELNRISGLLATQQEENLGQVGQIRNLQEQLAAQQKEVADNERRQRIAYQRCQQAADALREEITQLRNEIETKNQALATAEQTIEELTAINQQCQARISDLEMGRANTHAALTSTDDDDLVQTFEMGEFDA